MKALAFYQTGVLSNTMLKRVNGLQVELFATASERAQQSASASSAASANPAPHAITNREMGAEAVKDHVRLKRLPFGEKGWKGLPFLEKKGVTVILMRYPMISDVILIYTDDMGFYDF